MNESQLNKNLAKQEMRQIRLNHIMRIREQLADKVAKYDLKIQKLKDQIDFQ